MALRWFLNVENARGFYRLKTILRFFVPRCGLKHPYPYDKFTCARMRGHMGHHYDYNHDVEWMLKKGLEAQYSTSANPK